jgi:P-aminobenzoate N-oxygenase AurF
MGWLEHFETNSINRMEIPWQSGIHVEPYLRVPLIRSLQRFQVGEQGDGRHLITDAWLAGDATYARTIELFIKEEQEHSRLLARLLKGMNAPLLKWHWSDFAFVQLRRLCGLKVELMVLLSAEMIAKRYYRALYEGTSDPVLRTTFTQILSDELGHVAFHTDFLQRTFDHLSPPARTFIKLVWFAFYIAVARIVAHDHRAVLGAVGVSRGEFLRDCTHIFEETATSIFQPHVALREDIAK